MPRESRSRETFKCVVSPAQPAQLTIYLDHPPLPIAQHQRSIAAGSQRKEAIDVVVTRETEAQNTTTTRQRTRSTLSPRPLPLLPSDGGTRSDKASLGPRVRLCA